MTLKYTTFILPFSLLALWLISFFVDYQLAVHQHKPFFATQSAMRKDGGTTEYKGIGYIIVDYNQIMEKNGRTDVVFSSRFINYESKQTN